MITSRLGISPVSKNVIDAAIQYANEHAIQLMLTASRNQVDCKALGGGYIGLSTFEFIDYVKSRSKGNLLLCRSHAGSYQAEESKKHIGNNLAMELAIHSIEQDINAGFDLIHINCSLTDDVYSRTHELVQQAQNFASEHNRKIYFEVTFEENLGVVSDFQKFRRSLEFIAEFLQPEFVVGQTGSLVKELAQVGSFAEKEVAQLVALSHEFGFKFKEYSVDYASPEALQLRKQAGVDAINIGSEFGVEQSKLTIELAEQYGLDAELSQFLDYAIMSEKWRKWILENPDARELALMAGHYIFADKQYQNLVGKLADYEDIDKAINNRIATLIEYYLSPFHKEIGVKA